MKLPLSIQSAKASIRWPLSNPSHPLYYEPLSSLQTLRQRKSIPPTLEPIFDRGITEAIDDLTLNASDPSYKHNTILAVALLFLGNGLADECHDLITPLSWHEDSYFGGPTLCHLADDSVVAMASHVHSLLHRREGFAQGEFGMIGYQNANYWANAARAIDSSINDSEIKNTQMPYKEVREAVIEVSKEFGPEAEAWCDRSIVQAGEGREDYWETRALHELCANVSRENGNQQSHKLRDFAERAAEVELIKLLECCLKRAGYDIEVDGYDDSDGGDSKVLRSASNQMILDDHLAQSVANKVSSAHIGAFQSSRCVSIRNVAPLYSRGTEPTKINSFSIAAGLACRLFSSPAVKSSSTTNNSGNKAGIVHIIVPKSDSESTKTIEGLTRAFGSSFYGGGPLAPGDAFAFFAGSDAEEGVDAGSVHQLASYSFTTCDPSDDDVIFVDRFHGSRGDTPTSVLQWSKGTIHKSDHVP